MSFTSSGQFGECCLNFLGLSKGFGWAWGSNDNS